eukprot:COSAG02_NODE_58587_length_277_cov_0.561798_1_plen_76_part_10
MRIRFIQCFQAPALFARLVRLVRLARSAQWLPRPAAEIPSPEGHLLDPVAELRAGQLRAGQRPVVVAPPLAGRRQP